MRARKFPMNHFEFFLLPETGKLKEIWTFGIIVAERKIGTIRYELYQIDDYYVEVVRHNYWNIVKVTRSFKAICYLEPYLQMIDISGLVHT